MLLRRSLKNRIEAIRHRLFIARSQRIRPQRDDKILTDWNGLMIAALAKGGSVFNEPEYIEAAKRAADFILKRCVIRMDDCITASGMARLHYQASLMTMPFSSGADRAL